MVTDYEGKKEIFLFAKKWLDNFASGQIPEHEFEMQLEADCRSLGFQMDCGHEFEKRYPHCFSLTSSAIENQISSITDIDLLGSAVYSQWRYITHWANSSLQSEKSRRWFELVLKRMKELAGKG